MQVLPTLTKDLNVHVKTVVDKAIQELIGTKSVKQLNDEFIAKYNSSISHLYEAARIMYDLDASNQEAAIKLITTFDLENVKLEVSCTDYTFVCLHVNTNCIYVV